MMKPRDAKSVICRLIGRVSSEPLFQLQEGFVTVGDLVLCTETTVSVNRHDQKHDKFFQGTAYLCNLIHLCIRLSFKLENRIPAYNVCQKTPIVSIWLETKHHYRNWVAPSQARSCLPSCLRKVSALVRALQNRRKCKQLQRTCRRSQRASYSGLRGRVT